MVTKIFFVFSTLFILLPSGKSSAQLLNKNTNSNKSLSFVFNRINLKDTVPYVECTIVNNTDSTFWILTYDTISTQGNKYIYPIYSAQIKKDGKWKDDDLGFSGQGLQIYTISPGQKLLFETPDFDSSAEAIKIGLEIRLHKDNLRASREIWTDEIKIH